jgi:CBS domain-containing protein
MIALAMTNDHRMIVPLMAGVIVSLILSDRLRHESIYTLRLARRGTPMRNGLGVDVLQTLQVQESMVREPITLPADLPMDKMTGEFIGTGRHDFAVINEDGSLLGMVSLEDYRRASESGTKSLEELPVRDIASLDVVGVFSDDTVGTALRRMAPRDLSRHPVVARDHPRRLVGLARRNDLARAYDYGTMRRVEARENAHRTHAVDDDRAQFIDIQILAGSRTSGKTVAEPGLPRNAAVMMIRHGRDLRIPHGDIKPETGGTVTMLCERECVAGVGALFANSTDSESKAPVLQPGLTVSTQPERQPPKALRGSQLLQRRNNPCRSKIA